LKDFGVFQQLLLSTRGLFFFLTFFLDTVGNVHYNNVCSNILELLSLGLFFACFVLPNLLNYMLRRKIEEADYRWQLENEQVNLRSGGVSQ